MLTAQTLRKHKVMRVRMWTLVNQFGCNESRRCTARYRLDMDGSAQEETIN